MVKYDRLWETMRKKKVTQYRLIKYYNVSAGQIGRLKKNMYVSTHTIEMLCTILGCSVEEVMEVIREPQDGKKQDDSDTMSKPQDLPKT